MIAVFATGLSPAADAWAGDSSDVQEMRRELAQMRGQVLALQAAVVETTELERQRSANLTRAMKEFASAFPSQPAAPAAPVPAGEPATEARAVMPAAPSASSDEKPRRKSSKSRRHRRSGRMRATK